MTIASSKLPSPALFPYRWVTLVVVSIALLLIVIDMTVLYTALPALSHALHVSTSEKLWIVNVYSLVVAGLLLGAGTLGDHVGHRRLFMLGMCVFGAASLLAAFAWGAMVLIAARAMLGVGAALMMPSTLAIIRICFSDAKERAIAIGIWASIASGGAALGPVLGGVLLEYFWWGSVFLINVPIIVLTLLLSLLYIPRITPQKKQPWDGYSSILVMVGLIALVSFIKEITLPNTSFTFLWQSALVTFLFLGYFSYRQVRSHTPLITFSSFRNPLFSAGVLSAFLSTVVLLGLQLAFTQRLQLVAEHSPLGAALILLPLPLASVLIGPVCGYALRYVSASKMLYYALLVAAVSVLGFYVSYQHESILLGLSLGVFGAAIGTIMTTASTMVLDQGPADKAGMVASIEEVSYELGGAIGVAVMGSLLSATYSKHMEELGRTIGNASVVDSLDEAISVAERLSSGLAQTVLQTAKAGFDAGFELVVLCVFGVLCFAALAVSYLSKVKNLEKP